MASVNDITQGLGQVKTSFSTSVQLTLGAARAAQEIAGQQQAMGVADKAAQFLALKNDIENLQKQIMALGTACDNLTKKTIALSGKGAAGAMGGGGGGGGAGSTGDGRTGGDPDGGP